MPLQPAVTQHQVQVKYWPEEKPNEEPETTPDPEIEEIGQSEVEKQDTPLMPAVQQKQLPEVQRITQLHPTATSDRPRQSNMAMSQKYDDFVMCVYKLKSEAPTSRQMAWRNALSEGGGGIAENGIMMRCRVGRVRNSDQA